MKVRESQRRSKSWVADGDFIDDYIQPDGSLGSYYNYPTETEAQAALDLCLEKQKPLVEVKDTNPKDALGIKKAPLSTLPTGPMYEAALAMLEGARKYGRHNYRVMGVKASVYYDAAMGHLAAWWEGEDLDPASGLHHLAKAMACIAVVRDSMMMENWIDDRPPCYPNKGSGLMRNNPIVATILKKYPVCVRPYTEKDEQYNAAVDHETGADRTKPVSGGY